MKISHFGATSQYLKDFDAFEKRLPSTVCANSQVCLR